MKECASIFRFGVGNGSVDLRGYGVLKIFSPVSCSTSIIIHEGKTAL